MTCIKVKCFRYISSSLQFGTGFNFSVSTRSFSFCLGLIRTICIRVCWFLGLRAHLLPERHVGKTFPWHFNLHIIIWKNSNNNVHCYLHIIILNFPQTSRNCSQRTEIKMFCWHFNCFTEHFPVCGKRLFFEVQSVHQNEKNGNLS